MKQRTNKKYFFVVVVVLGLLFSGCATKNIKQNQQPVANQNLDETENQDMVNDNGQPVGSANSNQNQAGDSQTEGWKTYTNTQYGFEIKYPSVAKISDVDINGGRSIFIQVPFFSPVSGKNNLLIKAVEIHVVTEQWHNGVLEPANCAPYVFDNAATTNVALNGVDFVKGDISGLYGSMSSDSKAIQYCVMRGNQSFRLISMLTFERHKASFSFDVNEETKVLNQIISTFRFDSK